LIIDHYFSQGQGALVGTQANGGLHNYPVAALSEHELAAEVAAAQTFVITMKNTNSPFFKSNNLILRIKSPTLCTTK
ncbi:hypothetical protein, partial [Alloprevotella tannerae]|uniref:hypothetical protein n=1 Tax=Alloprevotella tannerae TaxID=76122 RepID=UPI003610A1A0